MSNILIREDALRYQSGVDLFKQISKKEIQLFRKETEGAYNYVVNDKIEFVDYDPYTSCEDMIKKVNESGVLLISNLYNNSELLPGDLNLKFRAVHDTLHYRTKAPFTYEGETTIYEYQKYCYSTNLSRRILFSEVVLQAAYKEYFGNFGDQKIVL